jgi:hypothetical protein
MRIFQHVSWPGVAAVESCRGTVGHGVGPAAFTLTTYPQAARPAEFGDLLLGDGSHPPVVLRDCKVDRVTAQAGPAGQTYTLVILDRRWRWAGGAISGRYNQLDPRGKMVPWSIRSPAELCRLCLDAAGEVGYTLDVPDGVPRRAGADLDRYLRLGEAFPQSLTNPPVVWDYTPPMGALAPLAESFGCRVIFQPVKNRVHVGPAGKGELPPPGLYEAFSPSLDAPETPSAVAVAGAPVRIQCRLKLEAVGREWDGEFLPINQLSYAPESSAVQQSVTVTYTGSGDPTSLGVNFTFAAGTADEKTASILATDATVATKLATLVSKINAHATASKYVTASTAAQVLTVTAKSAGKAFDLTADAIDLPAGETWVAAVVASPVPVKSWRMCPPPNFAAVRATERLSRREAIDLARQFVWRAYRVKAVNPETGKPPLELPWYGEVRRRQQLLLQPTKVEQVRPMPRDKDGREKGSIPLDVGSDPAFATLMGGVMPDFYDGYSRDQPATVTGSVAARIGSVLWELGAGGNTARTAKVYVPFTVDAARQLVLFAEPVFREAILAGTFSCVDEPDLTLETSVLVTHPDSGAVARWDQERLALGGRGAVEWHAREDVQVSVLGQYDPTDNELIAWTFEGLVEDARPRARHYLTRLAERHRLAGGEVRQYIGCVPVDLSGLVQQVTWSFGGGATTVVGINSEHDPWVPDYPERRIRENLPPDKAAAQASRLEQAFVDQLQPKPGQQKTP